MSAEQSPAEELERVVAEERTRVDETLKEIQRRLTPGQLIDEVLRQGRGVGNDVVGNLGRTLSDNPVPAALIGVGLLWLLLAPRPAARPPAASRASAASPGEAEAGYR